MKVHFVGSVSEKFRVASVGTMGSHVEDVLLTSTSVNECDGRRTLSHLPNRPQVDIEFIDISYTVPQGKKGKSQGFDWPVY